jgi:hypothetical protein
MATSTTVNAVQIGEDYSPILKRWDIDLNLITPPEQDSPTASSYDRYLGEHKHF